MFKKSIALAIPTLAASALVAASLSGGSVQASSSDKTGLPKPPTKAAKAVTITKCNGSYQKRSWDRGVAGYVFRPDNNIPSGLPGSLIRFRGPQHGRDAVSVNFSAGSLVYSGAYGTVKVLLDGTPMRPSDNVDGSYNFGPVNEYASFARNYCARVGHGPHAIRVVVTGHDSDGTPNNSGWYLTDPMLHAELSE